MGGAILDEPKLDLHHFNAQIRAPEVQCESNFHEWRECILCRHFTTTMPLAGACLS